MRILEEKMQRAIRDAQAKDPIMTVSVMQEHLEETFNRGFSRTYVKKLCDKVSRQALIEADHTQIA